MTLPVELPTTSKIYGPHELENINLTSSTPHSDCRTIAAVSPLCQSPPKRTKRKAPLDDKDLEGDNYSRRKRVKDNRADLFQNEAASIHCGATSEGNRSSLDYPPVVAAKVEALDNLEVLSTSENIGPQKSRDRLQLGCTFGIQTRPLFGTTNEEENASFELSDDISPSAAPNEDEYGGDLSILSQVVDDILREQTGLDEIHKYPLNNPSDVPLFPGEVLLGEAQDRALINDISDDEDSDDGDDSDEDEEGGDEGEGFHVDENSIPEEPLNIQTKPDNPHKKRPSLWQEICEYRVKAIWFILTQSFDPFSFPLIDDVPRLSSIPVISLRSSCPTIGKGTPPVIDRDKTGSLQRNPLTGKAYH